MLKQILFLVAVFSSVGSFAQVDVNASAGTPLGNYTTLKAAFDAINAGTHQGIIIIGISANTSEIAPAVLNSSGAGSASYTSVNIAPSVDGVVISGATTTGRGLIELKGADNVLINGDNPLTPGTNRNLTITNTASSTTTLTSVIRIATAATVVSADNISILNCNLIGSATGRNIATATSTSASENNTFVIYAGGNGGATATDAPAALTSVTTNTAPTGTTINNLTVSNNTLNAAARAIVFNGAAAGVSTGVVISDNLIGDQTNLTGIPPYTTPATTVYTKGIFISGLTSATVTNNSLKNILSFVGTTMNAIEFNSSIGTGAGVVTVSNNTITGVVNQGSSIANGISIQNSAVAFSVTNNIVSNIQSTGAGSVAGINISTTAPSGLVEKNSISYVYARNTGGYASRGILLGGGSNVTVQNNMIFDLNAVNNNSTTSSTYAIKGIAITSGTGHKVYHNSVNLFGTMLGANTAADNTTCLMISTSSLTGIDVRNNIFTNKMTGAAATVHACLQLPSGATSAMNLTLNNNAYYIGSNANSYIGILTSTFASYSTLPTLLAYTSTLSAAGTNDNASYASTNAAPFVSNSDLHLSLVSPELTNVEQKGATGIAGTGTDIDGNTRPDGVTTIPDIGADEVAAPVACSGVPTPGTISGTATICQGGSVVLTLNGLPAESGLSFQWNSSATAGGPYGTALGTSLTQNTGALAATTYYVVTVTCANGGATASTPEFTVTVNPNPVISVTPSSATYCNPGPGVSLTASGAVNYGWSPASGLSSNIGATVTATPTSTTTYTVTGVDALGCIGTTTVPVTVNASPVISSVTATPAAVCSGSSSQLQANASIAYNQTAAAYSFAGSTGTYTPVTGTTLTTASQDDSGIGNLPIGFTFPYNGNTFTVFGARTNGLIELGQATAALSGFSANALASTANCIAPLWDDNNMTGGTITYTTTGTAPNRVLTVQWTGMHVGNGGNPAEPTIDCQVMLYETTGVIEFVYGSTSASLAVATASIGISGASGNYKSVTPLSPANTSTTSSSTENSTISSAVNFPSGTIYTFTPPVAPTLTYAWSPATNLSSTSISNPVASNITSPVTYTVGVTASNGCSVSNTVSLIVNPLPTAPTATNSAQCGAQVPTASVASTSGLPTPSFVWYDAPIAGTVLQTSTSTTFTTAISTTTTFYVSELNTVTGCESSRTAVTVTVATADNITASINNATVCIGSSVNLSVVNANSTPVQNYTYTWTNA
ncbi:MAG: hypothetical protein IT221_04020, partial [Fluviicola sp.]|nr:hypothetical protein [Fluviicola sp.]